MLVHSDDYYLYVVSHVLFFIYFLLFSLILTVLITFGLEYLNWEKRVQSFHFMGDRGRR